MSRQHALWLGSWLEVESLYCLAHVVAGASLITPVRDNQPRTPYPIIILVSPTSGAPHNQDT